MGRCSTHAQSGRLEGTGFSDNVKVDSAARTAGEIRTIVVRVIIAFGPGQFNWKMRLVKCYKHIKTTYTQQTVEAGIVYFCTKNLDASYSVSSFCKSSLSANILYV